MLERAPALFFLLTLLTHTTMAIPAKNRPACRSSFACNMVSCSNSASAMLGFSSASHSCDALSDSRRKKLRSDLRFLHVTALDGRSPHLLDYIFCQCLCRCGIISGLFFTSFSTAMKLLCNVASWANFRIGRGLSVGIPTTKFRWLSAESWIARIVSSAPRLRPVSASLSTEICYTESGSCPAMPRITRPLSYFQAAT